MAAVLVITVSCKGTEKVNPKELFSGGFEAEFSYSLDDMIYSGEMTKDVGGEYKITMREPKSLENIIFFYLNGETTVSFDGVRRYEAGDNLGKHSVTGLLCMPLEAAAGSGSESGTAGSGNYALKISGVELKKITVDEIEIEIKNFIKK